MTRPEESTDGDSHDDAGGTTDERAVTVVGEDRLSLAPGRLRERADEERVVDVACSTGEHKIATWGGVTVLDLFDDVGLPDGTTHLLFEGADGFRVVVPVLDAIDGLVAVTRDGTDLAACEDYATRFVSADVVGTKCVTGLATVAALTLPAGTDTEGLEVLWPDESDAPDVEAVTARYGDRAGRTR